MDSLKIGDIVTRKSYSGDIYFRIIDIVNNRGSEPTCVLKALIYRLKADSCSSDLLKCDTQSAYNDVRQRIKKLEKSSLYRKTPLLLPFFHRYQVKNGKILHIDADGEFLDICLKHYSDAGLTATGNLVDEPEQPYSVKRLLEINKPDILVMTGHDSMKKSAGGSNSMDNYSNSKYFVQSVKEARAYEPSKDKLCIFAGACQSYYEAIMQAGANFASSPGRVLINALDPALVSEKVALTDSRIYVTPRQVSRITKSGAAGVGGINTRGHSQRL